MFPQRVHSQNAVLSLLFVPQSMAWITVFMALLSVPTMGSFQVSTGYYLTCAVYDGEAKCWGENSNGQLGLGNNSAMITYPPGQSIDLGTDSSDSNFMVDSMGCGGDFCCALSMEQSVKC